MTTFPCHLSPVVRPDAECSKLAKKICNVATFAHQTAAKKMERNTTTSFSKSTSMRATDAPYFSGSVRAQVLHDLHKWKKHPRQTAPWFGLSTMLQRRINIAANLCFLNLHLTAGLNIHKLYDIHCRYLPCMFDFCWDVYM